MIKNNLAKHKVEERVSVRRDILDTFQIFLTMPHLGSQKITICDMSRKGISFEFRPGISLHEGDSLECYLHLNKSIRIPLSLATVHLNNEAGYIKAGCLISSTETSAYKAYSNFVELLMSLTEFKES